MNSATNLWLTVLVATLLIFGSGCTKEDKEKVTGEDNKKPTDEIAFVDQSNGLPSRGLWRQGIAFVDLNGDGHTDILAPAPRQALPEDKFPVAWYGDGKGGWTKSRLDLPSDMDYDYGSITAADFNSDGIPDIALAMHCLGVRVLMGKGGGKYVTLSEGLPPKEKFVSRALVSDDFNNDGMPDIAAVSEVRFKMKLAHPTGAWAFFSTDKGWKCGPIAKDEGRGLFADQIVTGDINGDGNRDIALASLLTHNHNVVWLGDGKGGFAPFNKGLPKGEVYYASVALGDINGDGRDDLVAFISGIGQDADFGMRAFMSGQDGFEEVSEGLPQKQQIFTAISVADLDSDGRPEIIGGTGDGGIKIFSRNGKRWEEIRVSGLPKKGLARIYNIYCEDLNGDRHKDIALCYSSGESEIGGIRVFLNVPTKSKK